MAMPVNNAGDPFNAGFQQAGRMKGKRTCAHTYCVLKNIYNLVKKIMSTILITGATSGFGKACAEKFASAGYRLILTGRREERLMLLRDVLKKQFNTEALILPFDIRDQQAMSDMLATIPDDFLPIDILLNNAGLAAGRDFFQDASIDDWEQMIDTNLKGLLYITKAIIPGMIERRSGHIINISSLAGAEVYPQGNVYCATKHAVTALSKGMRQDLLQYGIRVTNISPGLAETEFSLVRFKGDAEKASGVYAGFEPLHAADVAEIIYFAASRPAHVNLEEITILPTAQSDAGTVVRNVR